MDAPYDTGMRTICTMDAPLRFGPFELDIANVRLVRDGQPVSLPPKAFAPPARQHEQSRQIRAVVIR